MHKLSQRSPMPLALKATSRMFKLLSVPANPPDAHGYPLGPEKKNGQPAPYPREFQFSRSGAGLISVGEKK